MKPEFQLYWSGEENQIVTSAEEMRRLLLQFDAALFAVAKDGQVGLTTNGDIHSHNGQKRLIAYAHPLSPEQLGEESFRQTYHTKYALYTGAMANGIASVELVTTMGQAGWLASFGAGGLAPQKIEEAIQKIQQVLPQGPYMFNLLHSPNEPALEARVVDLYLKYKIPVVEASAYINLTAPLVHYRLSGLQRDEQGKIRIRHRVIAKLSRLEMAQKFLEPAPEDIVRQLLAEGQISAEQAEWSRHIPVADDITVEADSGGHTDNRPLIGMLPPFLHLRDEIQQKYQYSEAPRIGAGGGIGTPDAALAAFMLGAAYVVTGSINQSCIEAGTSEHVRHLLSQADMADVAMAPAGDMFEMGVKVQVLKRGTMFPMRAQKLYELYSRYNAWEEIPASERERLEKTVFKRDFDSIWQDTVNFFQQRDPRQIERGNSNPKDKMALVFRWYLGLSSRWANQGEKGREMDYQIWCGPAMGAFNRWVKGTYLESPSNRHVTDVNKHILRGGAYLARLRMLQMQGISFPAALQKYIPEPL